MHRDGKKSRLYSNTWLLCVDFLEQSVGMSPAVHHEEDEADVDADAACQLLVEEDVAGKAVPVAVECQSYQFTLAVEHRRAAVATRDVVVGEEA